MFGCFVWRCLSGVTVTVVRSGVVTLDGVDIMVHEAGCVPTGVLVPLSVVASDSGKQAGRRDGSKNGAGVKAVVFMVRKRGYGSRQTGLGWWLAKSVR